MAEPEAGEVGSDGNLIAPQQTVAVPATASGALNEAPKRRGRGAFTDIGATRHNPIAQIKSLLHSQALLASAPPTRRIPPPSARSTARPSPSFSRRSTSRSRSRQRSRSRSLRRSRSRSRNPSNSRSPRRKQLTIVRNVDRDLSKKVIISTSDPDERSSQFGAVEDETPAQLMVNRSRRQITTKLSRHVASDSLSEPSSFGVVDEEIAPTNTSATSGPVDDSQPWLPQTGDEPISERCWVWIDGLLPPYSTQHANESLIRFGAMTDIMLSASEDWVLVRYETSDQATACQSSISGQPFPTADRPAVIASLAPQRIVTLAEEGRLMSRNPPPQIAPQSVSSASQHTTPQFDSAAQAIARERDLRMSQ